MFYNSGMNSSVLYAIAAVVLIAVLKVSAPAQQDNYSQPGPYKAGWRTVTVTRSNATTFTARLYYPAIQTGPDTTFDPAGRPYPAVTFGHGFLQAVSSYQSTLEHLATHGYLVIASNSESGLFPNHLNFANDLRTSLTYLEQENMNPGSILFSSVAVDKFGASGHSMGGGASILAASEDLRIKALANLAAAETNPSAKAAMPLIKAPVSLISAGSDTIVPVATNGLEMYMAARPPKILPTIEGGWHCGFQESNGFGCDSGTITREQQLSETRRLLASFFDLYLKGNSSAIQSVWGDRLFSSITTAQRNSGIGLTPAIQSVNTVAGQDISLAFTVTNLTGSPQAFKIEAAQNRWIVRVSPAITPTLAAGGTTNVTISTRRLWKNNSLLNTILITGTRDGDPLTAAFARIELK
jgi:pimeloyl-ACP methyl ester carboxylesterase